jgi:hypothetical protein
MYNVIDIRTNKVQQHQELIPAICAAWRERSHSTVTDKTGKACPGTDYLSKALDAFASGTKIVRLGLFHYVC